MHKNYKLDDHVLTNIIRRNKKKIYVTTKTKKIINTKFKTSKLKIKNNTNSPKNIPKPFDDFTYRFQDCLSENYLKNNTYIGNTTTTLSRQLTYNFSDTSTIKQYLMTKHNNDTKKLPSSDKGKILNNHRRIF